MFKRNMFAASIVFLCILTANVLAVPQPVVYYTFDELGDSVKDASGNGNDGVPMGNVKLVDGGKVGKCFEFDGQNSYIDLERVAQDNFTLMAWIKADQPGLSADHAYGGSGLIWSDVAGIANDFLLAITGTKLAFFAGNPDLTVKSDTDVTTGEWVHIAAVRSATDQKLSVFVNGIHEKTVDHANNGPLDAQPRIHIGGNTFDNRYYTGLIDEVKIFNTALIEQEVQEAFEPVSVDAGDKLSTTRGILKVVH